MENKIEGLSEIDDFEEEEEDFEKEEIKETKRPTKTKIVKEVEKEVPVERYVAFYQEPRLGIVDTITNEVIVEGLTDLPTAKLEAIKLNKLDKIGTVTGVD